MASYWGVLLVIAAVLVGLYATGNLNGTTSDYAASVTIDGNETFYATAEEAWKNVKLDKYTKFTLYKDWNADENGNFGYDGGFLDGMIYINRRSTNLDIDLNGYTIDRGLYNTSENIDSPRGNGSVIYFAADATVAISNGTIRGGNNNGNGGAGKYGNNLSLWGVIRETETLKDGSRIYVMKPNASDFQGKGNENFTGTVVCYNISSDYHPRVMNYFIAEDGYLESETSVVFIDSIYYYRN